MTFGGIHQFVLASGQGCSIPRSFEFPLDRVSDLLLGAVPRTRATFAELFGIWAEILRQGFAVPPEMLASTR